MWGQGTHCFSIKETWDEKQTRWESDPYPEPLTYAPPLQFPWVGTLAFPKSQSPMWKLYPPSAIHESTQRFLWWPLHLCGAQCRARLKLCLHAQSLGGWDSFSTQNSGGLVQTWHNQPRAPTRLDNRNIQQFVSWRLNSFVFYITTFFFHKENTQQWPKCFYKRIVC
jgi:hypothetical protein